MSASVVRLPLLHADEGRTRLPLLDQYLREQQSLTAVDRFAIAHDDEMKGSIYRDLIPECQPGEGQQYAFEVDLDRCTSCQACVTACHSLNGLDDDETWRAVGLLHGGTAAQPIRQAVTTACHHCVDPACLSGCPVAAYEKDPLTGIVKHLDDQCIGCQYCTLMCPYDVPQYSERLGIVRKCDMCSGRLAAGEAPACVQGCPNQAIAIAIVDKRQALEDAQGDAFLPGAPSPAVTVPTTVYKTQRALPRNLLPANFFAVIPSHQHRPLVVMLVLTELSVGAFGVDRAATHFLTTDVLVRLRPIHSLVALSLGLVALGASVFHLGRPRYAFRALIGLRTSWMSREILAFGLFAMFAALYAASFWNSSLANLAGVAPLSIAAAHGVEQFLGNVVAATGVAGVVCSVLVYDATKRAWGRASIAGFKFGMTTLVLGLAATILTLAGGAAALGDSAFTPEASHLVGALSRLLCAAVFLKLVWEAAVFRHLREKRCTDLQRTARLMTGDLGGITFWRFFTGVVGGLSLPWLTALHVGDRIGAATATASFALLITGEILERALFFSAASSPGMPGGIA